MAAFILYTLVYHARHLYTVVSSPLHVPVLKWELSTGLPLGLQAPLYFHYFSDVTGCPFLSSNINKATFPWLFLALPTSPSERNIDFCCFTWCCNSWLPPRALLHPENRTCFFLCFFFFFSGLRGERAEWRVGGSEEERNNKLVCQPDTLHKLTINKKKETASGLVDKLIHIHYFHTGARIKSDRN